MSVHLPNAVRQGMNKASLTYEVTLLSVQSEQVFFSSIQI